MNIEITTDLSRVTPEHVEAIYESVGLRLVARNPCRWTGFSAPACSAFSQSTAQEARPVGLLRAFSDDLFVTWISELCVMPSHQRRGIGARLMQAVNHRFAGHAVYAEPFTHNVDFITKQGLKARPILVACSRGPLPE